MNTPLRGHPKGRFTPKKRRRSWKQTQRHGRLTRGERAVGGGEKARDGRALYILWRK